MNRSTSTETLIIRPTQMLAWDRCRMNFKAVVVKVWMARTSLLWLESIVVTQTTCTACYKKRYPRLLVRPRRAAMVNRKTIATIRWRPFGSTSVGGYGPIQKLNNDVMRRKCEASTMRHRCTSFVSCTILPKTSCKPWWMLVSTSFTHWTIMDGYLCIMLAPMEHPMKSSRY